MRDEASSSNEHRTVNVELTGSPVDFRESSRGRTRQASLHLAANPPTPALQSIRPVCKPIAARCSGDAPPSGRRRAEGTPSTEDTAPGRADARAL